MDDDGLLAGVGITLRRRGRDGMRRRLRTWLPATPAGHSFGADREDAVRLIGKCRSGEIEGPVQRIANTAAVVPQRAWVDESLAFEQAPRLAPRAARIVGRTDVNYLACASKPA